MEKRINKRIVIAIFLFCILDVSFSFFTNTDSILMQSVYWISSLSVRIFILLNCHFDRKTMLLIRNIAIAYLVGGIIMYLYAYAFYHNADVVTWANNVNNYYIMVPIYTTSILSGILHTAWKRL